MNRTLFYMMIMIVAVFLIMDLVMIFTRKPPFEVIYYRANMEYDYTGNATFTTLAGLHFKNESEKEKYLRAYREGSLETFKEYFKSVGERLKRDIVPETFESSVTERPGILEIRETAFIRGVAVVEDGIVDTSMGELSLNTVGDSEIRMILPKGSTVLSVEPTPTGVIGNELVWKPSGPMVFPKVRFKKP